jgi:hypothetical protein
VKPSAFLFACSSIVGLTTFLSCLTMLFGTKFTEQQTGVVFGMAIITLVLMCAGFLARASDEVSQ